MSFVFAIGYITRSTGQSLIFDAYLNARLGEMHLTKENTSFFAFKKSFDRIPRKVFGVP